MSEYFYYVLVGLFVVFLVVNLLISVLLLFGFGGSLLLVECNWQIFKVSFYVVLIMLVSFYGGSLVMQVFGIFIFGLCIVGGLIVVYIGFIMLFFVIMLDEIEVQYDLLLDEEKIILYFCDLFFVLLVLLGIVGLGIIVLVVSLVLML